MVTRELPGLLANAQLATREYADDQRARAFGLLALVYQAAAMVLTKVGETDLAWIASDRGLAAAQDSGDRRRQGLVVPLGRPRRLLLARIVTTCG